MRRKSAKLLNENKSVSVTILETQQAATNSYVQLYSTYDHATANNAELIINDDLFVTNATSEAKLTAESFTKTINCRTAPKLQRANINMTQSQI